MFKRLRTKAVTAFMLAVTFALASMPFDAMKAYATTQKLEPFEWDYEIFSADPISEPWDDSEMGAERGVYSSKPKFATTGGKLKMDEDGYVEITIPACTYTYKTKWGLRELYEPEIVVHGRIHVDSYDESGERGNSGDITDRYRFTDRCTESGANREDTNYDNVRDITGGTFDFDGGGEKLQVYLNTVCKVTSNYWGERDSWEEERRFDMRLISKDSQKSPDKSNSSSTDSGQDWFSEHDLTLTSQEKGFKLTTTVIDSNDNEKGEMQFNAGAVIKEDRKNVESGYKNINCSFGVNCKKTDEKGLYPVIWYGAFDRFTGIALESCDGEVPIDYKGGTAYIKVEHFTKYENAMAYYGIRVTCPEDYDGAVFQIGYASMDLMEQNDKLNYETDILTVDEQPCFDNGHEYKYFALNDEPAVSVSSSKSTTEDSYDRRERAQNLDFHSLFKKALALSGASNATLDSIDPDGTLNIWLYDDMGDHTATVDWYYIDPDTLTGTNMLGDFIDLN